METANHTNRPDRLRIFSSDQDDRGDSMETRIKGDYTESSLP